MNKAPRSLLVSLLLATGSILGPSSSGLATVTARASYATEIVQYVREDKVYLLEKIRREITMPSEKAIVDALLTEDGPKAAALYRKQLEEYPDPQLDPISRSKLAEYGKALAMLEQSAPAPVKPAPKPTPVAKAVRKPEPAVSRPDTTRVAAPASQKPDSARMAAQQKPVKPDSTASPKPEAKGSYTLQFGSFDKAENAKQLAGKLPSGSPAAVIQSDKTYRVRLTKSFPSREAAMEYARSLPVQSIIVPIQ